MRGIVEGIAVRGKERGTELTPARGSSRSAWRSSRGCRRSGCTTRFVRQATQYGRVRDYVRAVRPREPDEAVVRFETPAARQGQVDFATFTLLWGRRHALVTVLSHSRLLWLRFYQRQTMEVLIEGLESAFGWFGGVPQELLFDQMRSVVLSDGRAGGGELELNADFLRFAAH